MNDLNKEIVMGEMIADIEKISALKKEWEENKKNAKEYFSAVFKYYTLMELSEITGVGYEFLKSIRRNKPSSTPFYLFIQLKTIKNYIELLKY